MEFNLRKLDATDIFPMSTIISKIGLDELGNAFDPATLKTIAETATSEASDTNTAEWIAGVSVTTKIVNVVLKNLPKIKTDLFEFLGSVSGMTAEEVAHLDMDVFMELIMSVVQKKEFLNFFKVVLKYIK